MQIEGEVADIIYKNEINGYLIATFETEEELTTIVGYMPFVHSADNLRLTGKFVEHKEYGRQFKVDTFEKLMPKTLGALEKYLANGHVKGIGETLAKRIINKFGEETIHVFKFEPTRLAEVRGISVPRAREMSESFNENWEIWQIVGFLDRFGISAKYAKKAYDLWGTNAIEEIEANPYLLLDIARGVDFKQMDQIALDLGVDPINEKRVKSGIKYALILSTYNGHSCVIKENLLEFVSSLLNIDKEYIEDNLIELKIKNEIVVEKREEQEWVYLEHFYSTEQDIAFRIKMLLESPNAKKIDKLEKELNKVQKLSEIELSDKQKEAVQLVNDNNVTIITGGPGTGKTTIIKSIIDLYEKQGRKVSLCAPTGRAAKKMTETTGKEASTLHRLLEIGKIEEDDFYQNASKYEGTPIDADIIIVDELSMVDMFLMNYLLRCIYRSTKLVLVGDVDQLSSVGPGSVLKDLIESETIPVVVLDKIFRQAAKSKIIVNAHRVNQGLGFINKEDETEETNNDFFFINEYSRRKNTKRNIIIMFG